MKKKIWFKINRDSHTFDVKGHAKTIEEAWDKSITNWELRSRGYVRSEDTECDADACGLCDLFVDDGCLGCPIAEKTDKTECYGTPYRAYRSALRVDCTAGERAKRQAERELAFLKKLKKETSKP